MIYFAYGANMSPGQIAQMCPEHRTIGVARLVDHRLCFPRVSRAFHCASAGIEPAPGSAVWGVLYDISDADLPVLNYHQGYNPHGSAAANEHLLRKVTVLRLGGSQPVQAMAYFAVPDGSAERPSAAYMQLLLDGAEYHGLPKAYVAALSAVPTR